MTTRTRRATHKDGAAAEAMLKAERTTTMTTKKTTGYVTELRRCTGSARFGIEPHDTAISTFPKQPSRKDGLGTMCNEHWRAYVKGLAADRKERVAGLVTDTGETVALSDASATKLGAAVDKAIAREARKAKGTRSSRPPDPKVAAAEAFIPKVDALPGDAAVERIGDPDVQAALELVGEANGDGRRETRLGETIDGSTEGTAVA